LWVRAFLGPYHPAQNQSFQRTAAPFPGRSSASQAFRRSPRPKAAFASGRAPGDFKDASSTRPERVRELPKRRKSLPFPSIFDRESGLIKALSETLQLLGRSRRPSAARLAENRGAIPMTHLRRRSPFSEQVCGRPFPKNLVRRFSASLAAAPNLFRALHYNPVLQKEASKPLIFLKIDSTQWEGSERQRHLR
jgi:hypothetical protein